jgi:hypothetical protein
MLLSVTCWWYHSIRNDPRGQRPQTCHSYGNDTHTPLPSLHPGQVLQLQIMIFPFTPVELQCVFVTAVLSPIIKLFAWGEGDNGGHVLKRLRAETCVD